jgi:CRISPR-associated protein Csx17
VSELDTEAWLSRARAAVRDKGAPANLIALCRGLDEALFRLASDGSSEVVQGALIAVGTLAFEAGRRPQLRENLRPPPRLSTGWLEAADDGSHEFALAAALASIDSTTRAKPSDLGIDLPFRCHLGPLSSVRHRDVWGDTTEAQALAVWTARNLVRDMGSVLNRRLIEAQQRSFVFHDRPELPLRGWRAAPLAAVAAFLAGRTDDHRISVLSVGLAWVRPHIGAAGAEREDVLPFAYAALKPLLAPMGIGSDGETRRPADALPVVRLLGAGRADHAVSLAQRMMRGTGKAAPFARLDPATAADPARLAAALLFPIAPMAYDRLVARAYPNLTRDEEEPNAA